MRKVLATTRPLKYGDLSLSKSATSLQTIARNHSSLPLTIDHQDQPIGEIRSLHYEEKNGVGQLTGVIADRTLKKFKQHGLSLKYLGSIKEGLINISKVIHATLTEQPRDTHTLVSDSEGELIEFQDSEDEAPAEDSAPKEEKNEPEEEEGTEIEITEAVLNSLRDRLLADPILLEKLKAVYSVPEDPQSKEEDPKPKDEVADQKQPDPTPLKIIIKHTRPQVAPPPPKAKPTIQRPFRSIKGK